MSLTPAAAAAPSVIGSPGSDFTRANYGDIYERSRYPG
jgi:hypothetical protein